MSSPTLSESTGNPMAVDAFRIATRGSLLALAQANLVADRIRGLNPEARTEIVEVATSGDRDRHSPIAALTEVGAFVRAVQQAVLDGRADLAVHSCKDLPVARPAELAVIYPRRAPAWDVLCGSTLDGLRPGARIGTGSPRRSIQLSLLRPDVAVKEVRGNVDTRLQKVAAGEFDAVVLAEAGLRRIGRTDAIQYRFTSAQMVPAPGQAALAIEVLADSRVAEHIAALGDKRTRIAVEAERNVLARAGLGCRAALGAYAKVGDNDAVVINGFVRDEGGPRFAEATGVDATDAADRLVAALEL